LCGDRLPPAVTINENVSEANSRQDATGLIGYDVYAPYNRSLLIKINFQIIQALRVSNRLGQSFEHLPLVAQFSLPRGVHEVIGENAVERCAITFSQCF